MFGPVAKFMVWAVNHKLVWADCIYGLQLATKTTSLMNNIVTKPPNGRKIWLEHSPNGFNWKGMSGK